MRTDQYGQIVFNERDLCDLLMQGRAPSSVNRALVESSVSLDRAREYLNEIPELLTYAESDLTVEEFDRESQSHWHMPTEYFDLDIAEYVLSLCENDAELQRCGHELLLYQSHGLFDLLRYLKYLVDTMRENNIIWGVGRGSSVSSYVLYKMGVHRIDSLYYDLAVEEFLR